VLGIPANPWDPEVRRTLGLAGSLRAWLDTLLPASMGTGGAATSVAALVRARMGRRVLDRLVSPVVGGVHSADPALLDVDMVAPGLRAGLRTHGSLAAAVKAQRRASTPAGPAPQDSTAPQGSAPLQKAGSAVAGLRGGMHTLVTALLAELTDLGVTLRAGTPAAAVRRTPTGWKVTAGGEQYDAGRLVVAVEGPAAVGLLSEVLPEITALRPAAGPDVKLVTLVLDRPELDTAPRGTGVLVAPQSPGIQAKALTHATAKWAWLDQSTAPGRHVLRLSYGRGATTGAPGSAPAGAMAEPDTEADLLAAALRDASTLLGVGLSRDDLAGWDVVRWAGALPFASLGHKQRVARVRELCAAEGDLAVVGGWVAGNGLAAIVADTPRQIASLLPAVARDSTP